MKITDKTDLTIPPRPGCVFIEVVNGVEGPCLTIGDESSALRLAGPKPWGGGRILYRFEVRRDELIREAGE